MNGSAKSIAMKIARIFGTNTKVCSWICVSACNSEITRPTTRPTSISGLAISTSVMIASRPTSTTSGPVIVYVLSSDRHLHDVVVGLHDAVTHRNQRGNRGFGFGNRSDDVDDVGLSGRERARLRVGFA